MSVLAIYRKNIKTTKMYKILFTIFLLYFFDSNAQRFNSTVFNELPEDYQLYPRNINNESLININGQVEFLGWKYFSVQIFREERKIAYHKSLINYNGNIGKFSFSPISIKAELAEYSFKVFGINTQNDSVEIVNRQHIVAGDAYVIAGQSNALALLNENVYQNKFARTYGAYLSQNPNSGWALSEYGNDRVGLLGGGIQKSIIEKYKIPVCIINQAVGGITIETSLVRDANNIENNSNNYGLTYYRVKKAGFLNGGIKAWIWRQGEAESSGGAALWGNQFDKLYKFWHTDYPKINKYYIFQTSLLSTKEPAGLLRDFQRRTKSIYPDIDNITCIGTQGYDGVHYDAIGHVQTYQELFRMIDRDIYGEKYPLSINSPNIQKAFFSKVDKTEITLLFEKDQKMIWTEDTLLLDKKGVLMKQYLRNNFYFDGNSLNNLVSTGKAVSNFIILSLNSSPPNNKFNYLPTYHNNQQFEVFGGPFLRNTTGMRAFSFDQVIIEEFLSLTAYPLSLPQISINPVSSKSLIINWKTIKGSKYYILEKKESQNESYQVLAQLDSAKIEYIDVGLKPNTTYYYRLKAINDYTETDFMESFAVTLAKLSQPEVTIETGSYKSLKFSWKTILNATSFILEKRLSQSEPFKEIAKLDNSKTEYQDDELKENTMYFYRIKASGDKTESEYTVFQAKTFSILAAEKEENEEMIRVYPNPANSQINISFKNSFQGQINISDIKGNILYENGIMKKLEFIVPIDKYPKGIYFINFKYDNQVISKKIIFY
jgi:Secretion system C-terminal sorting domain/Carbohydrate esterase, sialic acid-specific acetylesterase